MIEFDDVSKAYESPGPTKQILRGPSFRIRSGEGLAICGAYGAEIDAAEDDRRYRISDLGLGP